MIPAARISFFEFYISLKVVGLVSELRATDIVVVLFASGISTRLMVRDHFVLDLELSIIAFRSRFLLLCVYRGNLSALFGVIHFWEIQSESLYLNQ